MTLRYPPPQPSGGGGGGGGSVDSVNGQTGTVVLDAASVGVVAASTSAAGIVELATDGENAASVVVQGNDARLSNARTPSAHASTHLSGGSDPIAAATISAAGIVQLSADGGTTTSRAVQATDARLSDARTPSAHTTSHKHGGADEVATATASANAIPKAGSDGKLAQAWMKPGFLLMAM